MLKQKRIIIGTCIAIIALGLIVIFIYARKSNSYTKVKYDVYEITQPNNLTFSGKVQSTDKQTVTYNQSLGDITSINVEDGATVNAGDILLTYSSGSNQNTLDEKKRMQSQYSTNIANLENNLSEEKTQLSNVNDRVTKLKNEIKNTNTWSDSSDKTNKLSELQTELSEAQQVQQSTESSIQSIENSIISYHDMLSDVNASIDTLEKTAETVITANFEGVVNVNKDGLTNSSTPIVTVYGKEIVISITVTEYDIEKLAMNQTVSLSYTNQTEDVEGTISFISTAPESDSDTVTSYRVEISIADSIPLGYSVQVSVPQDEIRIPVESVITETNVESIIEDSESINAEAAKVESETEDSESETEDSESTDSESDIQTDSSNITTYEKHYVFKYEDGKAVKIEITIEKFSNYIIVTDGLSAGDIIIENPIGVVDQMEVSIS